MPTAVPEREIKGRKKTKLNCPKTESSSFRLFFENRSLTSLCLILALAAHVLGLLVFGTYTLFKGSVPRMPFVSEGGVSVEDLGMEAPPSEDIPEVTEDSAIASEAATMPNESPEAEADTVLAVSGLSSSSLPISSVPPALSATGVSSTAVTTMNAKEGSRAGAKASAINFFGVKGEGTNVYFVVDLSDSMLEQERGGIPGFAAVKANLKQMVQSLDEGTRFNIVAYGAVGVDRFEVESQPATREKKMAAEAFIEKYNNSTERRGTQVNNYLPSVPVFGIIQNERGLDWATTRLDLGLLAAFEGRADTIFLISDGKAPTLAEDKREEARAAMRDAALSDADRSKYQKELEKWKKDYAKFTEEMKTYRKKYKELLTKRDEKIQEAKAKGQGRVREGSEFVDYGVRIPGLPPDPEEPKKPEVPLPKNAGKVVKETGDLYDEAGLIRRIREVADEIYRKAGEPAPSIHTVGYMSKSSETKFLQALAAKNNGTFKAISAPIKPVSP
jgi:hypothetical protein